jgi:hypothetical protein
LALPGQLATHFPPEQTSLLPQVVPQAPQLLGSLSVLTQAPLHLAKPCMQVLSHAPARQMGMPFAGASHTMPHAPQFCASVMVSMQLDRHGEKPGSHATLHLAEVHTPLPWSGEGQAMMHVPQCAAELLVSTHEPPQLLLLLSQLSEHWPPEQTLPAAHALLQSPQRAGSAVRSTQVPSQSRSGDEQATPHTPASQVRVPLPESGHFLPQAPQLSTSVFRSAHRSPQCE